MTRGGKKIPLYNKVQTKHIMKGRVPLLERVILCVISGKVRVPLPNKGKLSFL